MAAPVECFLIEPTDRVRRVMAAPVECFLIEPTDRVRLALRRYRSPERWDEASQAMVAVDRGTCPLGYMHEAKVPIGESVIMWTQDRRAYRAPAREDYANDPRWPTQCACGEAFRDGDEVQVFPDRIYRRVDTGAELTLREAPPGAMWDAEWRFEKGPDGRSIMVRLPDGHDWCVDARASNCTLPKDDEHRCWLRTGELPRITVGKFAPGQRTCSAGAGSIATPKWHGFLRDGRLVVA